MTAKERDALFEIHCSTFLSINWKTLENEKNFILTRKSKTKIFRLVGSILFQKREFCCCISNQACVDLLFHPRFVGFCNKFRQIVHWTLDLWPSYYKDVSPKITMKEELREVVKEESSTFHCFCAQIFFFVKYFCLWMLWMEISTIS